MSKKKVTIELVFEVAQRQTDKGITPSAWTIREELGFGSLETIHKYLLKWRETVRRDEEETFEMPDDVLEQALKFLKEMWNSVNRSSVDMVKLINNEKDQRVAAANRELAEHLRHATKIAEDLDEEKKMRVADQLKIDELKRELHVKEGELQEARKNYERMIGEMQQKVNEERVNNEQVLIELALARGRLEE